MHKKTVLGMVFLSLLVLGLTGCSTIKPMPYSFEESSDETATIYFSSGNPGVRLVYLDDEALPEAGEGLYWDPIIVRAGTEFTMCVHAYYSQQSNTTNGLLVSLATAAIASSRSVDTDIEFVCPVLEKGKEYVMEFRKGSGLKGSNAILLLDKQTMDIVFQVEF